MISKEKAQFLAQLIQSMQEAAYELDKAIRETDFAKIKRVKDFILALQVKITEVTREK
ncbi:hypothetical protein HZA33_03405 [Candidatus Pacearchaeota archaeon]|nr:hypothetical protein [Candidatus Pacearchaeota archaeon]